MEGLPPLGPLSPEDEAILQKGLKAFEEALAKAAVPLEKIYSGEALPASYPRDEMPLSRFGEFYAPHSDEDRTLTWRDWVEKELRQQQPWREKGGDGSAVVYLFLNELDQDASLLSGPFRAFLDAMTMPNGLIDKAVARTFSSQVTAVILFTLTGKLNRVCLWLRIITRLQLDLLVHSLRGMYPELRKHCPHYENAARYEAESKSLEHDVMEPLNNPALSEARLSEYEEYMKRYLTLRETVAGFRAELEDMKGSSKDFKVRTPEHMAYYAAISHENPGGWTGEHSGTCPHRTVAAKIDSVLKTLDLLPEKLKMIAELIQRREDRFMSRMMYRLQLVMTAGLFIQAAMLLSVGITQVKDNWLFSAVLFLASLLLTALVIGGLRLWEVRGATKKVKGQAAPVRGDPVKDRAPHPVDDSEPPPD